MGRATEGGGKWPAETALAQRYHAVCHAQRLAGELLLRTCAPHAAALVVELPNEPIRVVCECPRNDFHVGGVVRASGGRGMRRRSGGRVAESGSRDGDRCNSEDTEGHNQDGDQEGTLRVVAQAAVRRLTLGGYGCPFGCVLLAAREVLLREPDALVAQVVVAGHPACVQRCFRMSQPPFLSHCEWRHHAR